MNNLRSGHFLYRQTLPISHWLPILEPMNTRYITNGSCINSSRFATWKELPVSGS